MNKCKIDNSKKKQLIDLAIKWKNLICANVVTVEKSKPKKCQWPSLEQTSDYHVNQYYV